MSDWSDREGREYQRESRRRQWISRFRDRQHIVREWIPIPEIADWCARSVTGADAAAEERARALAYERLDQSARGGEFDVRCHGRMHSQILYLHPRWARHGEHRRWLTREQLRHTNMREQAAFCWLPRELVREWLGAHSYLCPAHFDPPPAEAAVEGTGRLGGAVEAVSQPRPTPAQLDAWMQNNYRKGDKREPTVKACRAETGAHWRDAIAAYQRIPAQLT